METLKEEMESKILKTVRINNVPYTFWEEFQKDAKDKFADNYIMKIMVDHQRGKVQDERVLALIDRIAQIEERLNVLEGATATKSEPVEEKKLPKTFGGSEVI